MGFVKRATLSLPENLSNLKHDVSSLKQASLQLSASSCYEMPSPLWTGASLRSEFGGEARSSERARACEQQDCETSFNSSLMASCGHFCGISVEN